MTATLTAEKRRTQRRADDGIFRRNYKWNERNLLSESTDSTPFRFTGKERDEETGLYYYGARYLDPRTSRWLSTDEKGRILAVGESGLDSFDSDNFNNNDKAGAIGRRLVAYLGTPSGKFLKYNPSSNSVYILGVGITHKQQYLSTIGFYSYNNHHHTLRYPIRVMR